tara:strand:- start:253 stop:408 length:156 start_codon:yes stop_codon:yes gene_type:complete
MLIKEKNGYECPTMESILNGLIRLNISFIQDVDIIPNKWKNPNYDYYYIQV